MHKSQEKKALLFFFFFSFLSFFAFESFIWLTSPCCLSQIISVRCDKESAAESSKNHPGVFSLYTCPDAARGNQRKRKTNGYIFLPTRVVRREMWGTAADRKASDEDEDDKLYIYWAPSQTLRDPPLQSERKANGDPWFLSAMLFENRPAHSEKYSSKSLGGQSQRGCVLQHWEARSFN